LINYDEKYTAYLELINNKINVFCDKLDCKPEILAESMKYSLLAGGKRIRPVLMIATAETLGVPAERVLNYALAIELIHTYSLVHDDLPAMDNDDFRRGKPSNHKKFGEANAILAGDALLNEAYSICFNECTKGEKYAYASRFLNESAGIYGMVAGQSADLYFSQTQRDVSEADLRYVHEHKTGKLLLAPVVIASILGGSKSYLSLEQFGRLLGVLFQITDDILDVTGDFEKIGKTVGKDEKENKLTYVRLYGLEGAKVRADMCAKDCHAVLEGVDGEVEFLHDLVDYVLNRTH
jgi:geranylgeranyl diphosphate synthase type II